MAATPSVSVDWDDDGDFGDTGEDITSRALDRSKVKIRTGRDQAQALSPVAAGEAGLEINNHSRDYSPENGSSPLAGNVLPGRTVLIDSSLAGTSDTYTGRTEASGWGTSTSGHTWTTAGGVASNYAVSGGVGTITMTSVNVSRRASLAATDPTCVARATISIDATAAGAPIRTAVIPRATTLADDHQRGQLSWDTDGTLTLSLVERVGGTDSTLASYELGAYTATNQWVLEVETDGERLRGRAWLASGTMPDWQATATVASIITASEVGIRCILATGNTNTNPVITVDDWSSALAPNLFTGHLDDLDVLPDADRRSVQVTCLDGLAKLRGVPVTTVLHRGVRTGDAIGLVLDAAGWPSTLRDLDSGATIIAWWWADDDDAYDMVKQLVASEGPPALLYSDGDGKIVFRDRHHRITRLASLTSRATFTTSGAEPRASSPMTYRAGWREIINTVAFTPVVRQLDGELSAVWSSTDTMSIADGQTITVVAVASTPFWGAVTPQASVDYTLLSGTVTVTISRTSGQSTAVQVTASGGAAVLTGLQVRAYALATISTVQILAEDSVSTGKYGPRALPSSQNPVWAGVEDCKAIADLILGHRAERLPTVTITVKAANSTRQIQQLARRLSDRITITDDETGLNGDEFFIEQITHEIGAAGYHVTMFGCEKVRTPVATVFTFDVAGKGFDDGAFGATGMDNASTVFRFDTSGQGFNDGLFAT